MMLIAVCHVGGCSTTPADSQAIEKDCIGEVSRNVREAPGKEYLHTLDGQQVRLHDKLPIIDDKRSPYDGLAAADYKELVLKPWKNARTKINREHTKICGGVKGADRTPAMIKSWEIREAELMKANPEWKDLFSVF